MDGEAGGLLAGTLAALEAAVRDDAGILLLYVLGPAIVLGAVLPCWLPRFVRTVDALNDWVGRMVSWLCVAMVLTTFAVVVMRYVFNFGRVDIQESYVWMHGLVFMVGAGYALLHDAHVRVDVIYRPASIRYKAWVDLFGVMLLLMPVLVILAQVAMPYVWDSWDRGEVSREAGGLPRLYLLKTAILVFCALVLLQGLSLAARSYLILRGYGPFVDEANASANGEE